MATPTAGRSSTSKPRSTARKDVVAPERASSIGGLSSVRKVGSTEQVRNQLLAAIQRGDFPPGSMLPSERVLCETFEVSRVSVREAISGLEAVGLVTVRHGRGAFVRSGLADPGGPFVKYLELHREELLELLKVRGALDELAAAEAASEGTDEGLAQMVAARDAFSDAVARNDLGVMAEKDVAFHVSIAKCSVGQLLPQLLVELNGVLEESRRMTLAGGGRSLQSVKEHAAIVDAILTKNPRAARRAVARHIKSVRNWILKFSVSNGDQDDGPEAIS